jgi:hypothetical protein
MSLGPAIMAALMLLWRELRTGELFNGHEVVVFGEAHLRRILRCYAHYYNEVRTHRSLNKDAPVSRMVQRIGTVKSGAIFGGLHHHSVRI